MSEVLIARSRDADLIPSNVRAGVTIYDTLGTYTGEGGLPPGGNMGMFDITMTSHNTFNINSPTLGTHYYYEDVSYISCFVERNSKDGSGRYSGTVYYFNIDKSTGETYLYSVGSIYQGLLHHAYVTTITPYGVYEDDDYIYYIISGVGTNIYSPNEEFKSIGIIKFNKTTHNITVDSYNLTEASGYTRTGVEELTYLPPGYTSFTNPSPLPTDMYRVVNVSLQSGAYSKIPYITKP